MFNLCQAYWVVALRWAAGRTGTFVERVSMHWHDGCDRRADWMRRCLRTWRRRYRTRWRRGVVPRCAAGLMLRRRSWIAQVMRQSSFVVDAIHRMPSLSFRAASYIRSALRTRPGCSAAKRGEQGARTRVRPATS